MSYQKEKHLKGRFWILNKFIRVYAKNLSIQAQMIYICLCNYSGTGGEKVYSTFVGYRRIAENLGINKDTVAKHIKQLVACGLVSQHKSIRGGGVTHYNINTDPLFEINPSYMVGLKDFKNIKERNNSLNSINKQRQDIKDIRNTLVDKFSF